MDYQTFDRADLLPLINEASEGKTKAEFVAQYLASVARLIESDPARYRGYGAYWWLLKKELIAGGFNQFGEDLHDYWVDALDYGEPSLNITAAWLYSEQSWGAGSQYSNQHSLVDSEGDSVPVAVEDAEIEGALNAHKMV